MIGAVIFDLDGVLAESDRYHFSAWQQTCEKWDCQIRKTSLDESSVRIEWFTLVVAPFSGCSMRNPTQSTVVSRPLHHKKRREHHVYSLRFL